MERQMFLDSLRKALYGKISDAELEGHIRYYETYMAQEAAKGRSEAEILGELGDPRLLAKTIAETAGGRRSGAVEYTISEDGQEEEPKVRVRDLEGWKAMLFKGAVFAVILLVIVLIFHLMVALLPFLCLLGLGVWVIRILQNRR